jgi:hypothetical protein
MVPNWLSLDGNILENSDMKAAMYMTAATILAGCAAMPSNSGLDSYVGQNVSTLNSRLGFPSKQTASGGATVYTWTKVETVDGIVNGDEFQATQSAQGSSRLNSSQCRVNAAADASGIVNSIHADGSCARTVDLLRK